MAALARGERLQIMVTDEELVVLDNWRFDKRMPSRASAVRELLKRGLAAEGVALAGRLRSQDVGILEPAQKKVKSSHRSAGSTPEETQVNTRQRK